MLLDLLLWYFFLAQGADDGEPEYPPLPSAGDADISAHTKLRRRRLPGIRGGYGIH